MACVAKLSVAQPGQWPKNPIAALLKALHHQVLGVAFVVALAAAAVVAESIAVQEEVHRSRTAHCGHVTDKVPWEEVGKIDAGQVHRTPHGLFGEQERAGRGDCLRRHQRPRLCSKCEGDRLSCSHCWDLLNYPTAQYFDFQLIPRYSHCRMARGSLAAGNCRIPCCISYWVFARSSSVACIRMWPARSCQHNCLVSMIPDEMSCNRQVLRVLVCK